MKSFAEPADATPSIGVLPAEQLLALPDRLLDLLPVGLYVCDAAGLITRYNRVAAELWGSSPRIGDPASRYCGSHALYRLSGAAIAREECPVAEVLETGSSVTDQPVVFERPDGSRVVVLVNIEALKDGLGRIVGTASVLINASEQSAREAGAQRLAAIIEDSADAILAKDLDGVITSWNRGAERLFGYTAEEAVGRSVTMLIPADRQDEEVQILSRIRRGERVNTYETIRQRKDGSLVDISLTVSPIKDMSGRIIGASKIARDITERRRAEERQRLLLREMAHRVKNLFAVSSSMVALSARSATTPEELAAAVRERLGALARAHALTLPHITQGDSAEQATTLHALIRSIVSPYDSPSEGEDGRVAIQGADVAVAGGAVTNLALLLHEFTTNAAKYGALSLSSGRIAIECAAEDDRVVLTWTEADGPPIEAPSEAEGFGGLLVRMTVRGQLGGDIAYDWRPQGLAIRLTLAKSRLGA